MITRYFLSIKLLIITNISLNFLSFGQIIKFEQYLPAPNHPIINEFHCVSNSNSLFFDVDGDGDQDLFVTGITHTGDKFSTLYLNLGDGNFVEHENSGVIGIYGGDVAISDVNGDGNLDLLIAGSVSGQNDNIAKLYLNDGNGNFTEVENTPFIGSHRCSIAFSDVDGDGDEDVIVASHYSTKLYLNDGQGNFTEAENTPFLGLINPVVTFIDVDGDGYDDFLETGVIGQNNFKSKLYINQGDGTFSEGIDSPFDKTRVQEIVCSDIDMDGDVDVFISYRYGQKMYKNEGGGNFSEVPTSFDEIDMASIAFLDINNDGYDDVFISGEMGSWETPNISKLFLNDGTGEFTEYTTDSSDFIAITNGSVAVGDVDGDGIEDIFITGINRPRNSHNGRATARLYKFNEDGEYAEALSAPFLGVRNGDIDFVDINGDGYQDIMISGSDRYNKTILNLYKNDGTGNFSLMTNTGILGAASGRVAFADIDRDGSMDILVTGSNSFYNSGNRNGLPKLYTNDGLGNFTQAPEQPTVPFTQPIFNFAEDGGVAFTKFDNQGNQYLILAGKNHGHPVYEPFSDTEVFRNDGTGTFTKITSTQFKKSISCQVVLGDVNNSGREDVLITGSTQDGTFDATLYFNLGQGNFIEIVDTPFHGVLEGDVAFADVDGDGDLDVFITGFSNADTSSRIYINDGLGNFTKQLNSPFYNLRKSSVKFFDVDNDGDQDVIISGQDTDNGSNPIVALYLNDGNGIFTEVLNSPFENLGNGNIAVADVNNDDKLDVLISGHNADGEIKTILYLNNTCYPSFFTDSVIACDSYTWIDGNTYTESTDTAKYVLTNSVGCDSIISLNLTLIKNGIDEVNSCEPYKWIDGITYTESTDTTQFILTDVSGCDSIVTLNLTINANSDVDTVESCEPYTWVDGITYTENNDTAQFVLTNMYGCDSIVTLNLTILSNTGIDEVFSCQPYTWIDGITYTENNDTAQFALTNIYGCDSIVTLNLLINSEHYYDTVITCGSSYFWEVDENTYTESGVFTSTYINQLGCDSSYTIDLIFDCNLYVNVSVTNNVGSDCEGIAEANVYGGLAPYSYLYSNGVLTSTAQNLCSGVYHLDVSDSDSRNYQTTFVVSDETIDYNYDPTYTNYVDSLFTSASEACDFDFTQPVDTFYLDVNSIILLDDNIVEATWYIYQGVDTFIFTNTYYITDDVNGAYAYVLTIYCEDEERSLLNSANFIFKTKGELSTSSPIKDDYVLVYPNPAITKIVVEVPASLVGQELILTNTLGQVVLNSAVTAIRNEFNISDLSKGVYYVRIKSRQGFVTTKLVIQ